MNFFSFNNEYYGQIGGVAMGSKMGPNCACLFVGYVKQEICEQYSRFTPQLYKRYIDDIVGVASCTREELEAFIDFVSNFHPALQFTSIITETELPAFWTSTYTFLMIRFKQILTFLFFPSWSLHIRAIPYSQFLLLRRLCSDDDDLLMRSVMLTLSFP